ncbi:1658_t:CDS:2, partial [Funneliformis caledonium]
FFQPKNVDKAIEAAKQVEKQLSLNYTTFFNALFAKLEGNPEKKQLKDDRNLTKECMFEKIVYQKKSNKREANYIRVYTDKVERKRQSESKRELNLKSRKPNDEFMKVESLQIVTLTFKRKLNKD